MDEESERLREVDLKDGLTDQIAAKALVVLSMITYMCSTSHSGTHCITSHLGRITPTGQITEFALPNSSEYFRRNHRRARWESLVYGGASRHDWAHHAGKVRLLQRGLFPFDPVRGADHAAC